MYIQYNGIQLGKPHTSILAEIGTDRCGNNKRLSTAESRNNKLQND